MNPRRSMFFFFATLLCIYHFSKYYFKHYSVSNPVNVLIIAYPRSGSSLLGSLLSAPSTARYLFEPLYLLEPRPSVSIPASRQSEIQFVLRGAFDCDPMVMKRLRAREKVDHFVMFRKGFCSSERKKKIFSPQVLKLIRLRLRNVVTWIKDTNYKVVHLVRDPRAILSSMRAKPERWTGAMKLRKLCSEMEEDFKLGKELPGHQYHRVQYEDLVGNMSAELSRVYNFLGVSFSAEVEAAIHEHTHNAAKKANVLKGPDGNYFSVYRGANFTHDSWKRKLAQKDIVFAEDSCHSLIKQMDYKPFMTNV